MSAAMVSLRLPVFAEHQSFWKRLRKGEKKRTQKINFITAGQKPPILKIFTRFLPDGLCIYYAYHARQVSCRSGSHDDTAEIHRGASESSILTYYHELGVSKLLSRPVLLSILLWNQRDNLLPELA